MSKLEELILGQESVMGWDVYPDTNIGTIRWENIDSEISILATPYWENEDSMTPFDITDEDGNYQSVMNQKLIGTNEERLAQYITTLKEVITHVATIKAAFINEDGSIEEWSGGSE